jgi:hypothetical protein
MDRGKLLAQALDPVNRANPYPLYARLREAQVALSTLARRLVNPRLVTDPPPYQEDASLRGPEHLLVAFDRLID